MDSENAHNADAFFEALAAREEETGPRESAAPSVLKSRLFSALVRLQQQDGPLTPLNECRRQGSRLCVFEHLVAIAPVGQTVKAKNPCEVCHARVLGENLENAPIYWPGCPYVRFQNR